MRGHCFVSDQDLPIRMCGIPGQLRIWSILSGNALISSGALRARSPAEPMLRGARASSETSASRPPVEAHRLMSFERAEPLVVRKRQRGVLWVIARPYFGGANELRTHGLARVGDCCGLGTLCRNSDN